MPKSNSMLWNRILVYVLAGALLGGCVLDEFTAPEEIFVKIYGESMHEEPVDILETPSGFVILASTNSGVAGASVLRAPLPSLEELKSRNLVIDDGTVITYGSDDIDYLVMFTDQNGNLLKRFAFNQSETDTIVNGTVANSTDVPSSIRHTSDGGYIIVGTSTYTLKEKRVGRTNATVRQSDIFVVKLNADGEKEFQRVYGDVFYNPSDLSDNPANWIAKSDEKGADVAEHLDGYVLFGSTTRVGEKTGLLNLLDDRGDFLIAKIDKKGNFLWQKVTGFPGLDEGKTILPAAGNTCVIMGITGKESQEPVSAGGNNVMFAKIDETGERRGVGFFGLDGDEIPSRMHKISEDDFYIVGSYIDDSKRSRAFIMEVTISSSQRFHAANIGPTEDVSVEATDAVKVPGIGYWVVGKLTQFSENGVTKKAEMLLMRTSTTGQLDASFGDNVNVGGLNYGGIEDDKFVRILRLNSGHLVMLGMLGFEGGSTMICLVKANAQGNLEEL